jgi:hypothetical protein
VQTPRLLLRAVCMVAVTFLLLHDGPRGAEVPAGGYATRGDAAIAGPPAKPWEGNADGFGRVGALPLSSGNSLMAILAPTTFPGVW